MTLPKRVYIDTCALLSEGWPQTSAALRRYIVLARVFKIKTIVPQPVALELEAKWFREFCRKLEELRTAAGKLNKHLVWSEVNLEVEDEETTRNKYLAKVEKIKELYGLETIPFIGDHVSELFQMSLRRQAPFTREKDVGFQDAVILLSVLDDLQRTGDSGTFVSKDSAFKLDDIQKLAESRDVKLEVVNSVEEVSKILLRSLKVLDHRRYQRRQKLALSALREIQEQVKAFTEANLEIPKGVLSPTEAVGRYGIFGTLVGVRRIFLREIVSASPADPLGKKPGQTDDISAEAEVMSHVVVEGTSLRTREEKKFKVGEEEPSALVKALKEHETQEDSYPWRRVVVAMSKRVTIEASATVTDTGYADIKLTGVRLK